MRDLSPCYGETSSPTGYHTGNIQALLATQTGDVKPCWLRRQALLANITQISKIKPYWAIPKWQYQALLAIPSDPIPCP